MLFKLYKYVEFDRIALLIYHILVSGTFMVVMIVNQFYRLMLRISVLLCLLLSSNLYSLIFLPSCNVREFQIATDQLRITLYRYNVYDMI